MATEKKNPVKDNMIEMKMRREQDSRYTRGPSGIPRYARWLKRRGEMK